jgi:hypothetical protein
VNLTANACVSVAGSPAGFPGEFCTFTQGGWGAKPNGANAGALLAANFNTVYPGGSVTVGGAFTMTFANNTVNSVKKVKGKTTIVTTAVTGPQVIETYLPAGKTAGQLTANLFNGDKSSSGVFGGQVLALQLSVDFSGPVTASGLGSVKYCASDLPSIQGRTISQILAKANAVLGGATTASQGLYQQDGITPMTIAQLNDLITNLNEAYDNCSTVSGWANAHLCAF